MSKLLELLNLVRYHDNFGNNRFFVEEYQELEKEIEMLEEQKMVLSGEITRLKNKYKREHKTLKVVKEKDVSMYWLRNSKSVDEYNNFILTDKRQYQKLTKEEYDLLKEVLGE